MLKSVTAALSTATLCLVFWVLPNAVYAQSAEQHQREMNDISATPIKKGPQGGDDEVTGYDLPSRPSRPGFMATAYSPDTSSVWTSVGHATLQSAEKQALAGCNSATGGACFIAAAIEGTGRVSVTEDAMGQLWVKGAVGNEMLSAIDPSVQYCLQNSFGCNFLGFHDSGTIYLDEDPAIDQSKNYFPKGTLHRNRWAMVAGPTSEVAGEAPKRGWLISGRENSVEARKEILELCQAESGQTCIISAYALHAREVLTYETGVSNGILVHFVDAAGRSHWTSAVADRLAKKHKKKNGASTDPLSAKARVEQACPKVGTCKIIATYDAASVRLQRIDYPKR